ncbi:putative hydroxypyruvate isomerase isoform X2 [Cylas formicarius]|uniref:putative hydroxypyruvate isomerase isoform X2 n=1 Tax=Cylas formicarius TaxID=197179 RepID=UPI002958C613|nr:putative hydroxypyruvate isomerase isoform X2 [Cylas formicarius]
MKYRLSGATLHVKIMPKFCANLAFLFKEKPLLERYSAAKAAGFKAVETGFPYGFSKEQVISAKNSAGIEQVLINILTGDVTKGELGHAALPGSENEFKKNLETTIEFAKALGAKKIHIMSGRVNDEVTSIHDQTYVENLRYAAKVLEKENLIGLIEPINKYSVPGYYMNSYEKALAVLKSINSPSLKLQLDIFHLQLIKGDITHTIKALTSYIGHVQIAQVPGRNEPNTEGEINYKYIFDLLKQEGYNDWIGLEYNPQKDTESGLNWINKMGYTL